MDLLEAMNQRKSARAFKPDPVPRHIIEAILNQAGKAPSAINLQPWEFYVVSGEEKAWLCRRLLKSYREKQISCKPATVKPLPEIYTRRGNQSRDAMKPYFDETGVPLDRYINEGSCNFYGAPVAIIICLDDAFNKSQSIDIGLALGYLLLAAHNYGVATCPVGLIAAYQDDVKDLLNIPENKDIIIGVALGYPDPANPVNEYKSPREDLTRLVKWFD